MNTAHNPYNAFTVDVEDYFHVQAFADRVERKDWDHFESRVVPNTRQILRMLDDHQVAATFFVLGWVARRFPHLVREIQRSGHEIGCHSYAHKLVYEQTRDEFRADLKRATDVLQQITGDPVIAYRAPCFSITKQSEWALDILIEQGYRLDSSVVPVRHDTYGMRGANADAHVVQRANGRIIEVPPAVRRSMFGNIPVGGGGYFRLFPYRLTRHWLRSINRKEGRAFTFYIHPWEIDPRQPKIPAGLKSRFRHYRNLRTTEAKLHALLRDFRFSPLLDSFGLNRSNDVDASLIDTAHNFDVTKVDLEVTETDRAEARRQSR